MKGIEDPDALPTEERPQYFYYQGLIGKKKATSAEKLDVARGQFQKALEYAAAGDVRLSLWVAPHATTELADIAMQQGDLDAANSRLEEAKKKWSGYDFDKPLLRRIARYLDQIKRQRRISTSSRSSSTASAATSTEDAERS